MLLKILISYLGSLYLLLSFIYQKWMFDISKDFDFVDNMIDLLQFNNFGFFQNFDGIKFACDFIFGDLYSTE